MAVGRASRERGPRPIAQQSLKPGSVVGLDGDAGIERKPATVSPPTHVFGRLGTDKAIALEQAKHPVPDEALNSGDVAPAEHGGGMEPQFPGRALGDDAVNGSNVEVQTRILPFEHASAEPNRWQGLFLQSYYIPAIPGGQMKGTAPKRALSGALGEHSRSRVSSALGAAASTCPHRPGSRCKK